MLLQFSCDSEWKIIFSEKVFNKNSRYIGILSYSIT